MEEVERMTEEEVNRKLVEMILKMSPAQLAKAAAIVYGEYMDQPSDEVEIVA